MMSHQHNPYGHSHTDTHDEHFLSPEASHTPTGDTPPPSENTSFLRDILFYAAIALIIVIPVRMFIAQPFMVKGASMSPTFETGQYLIINQLAYRLYEPARFDVVVFRYPREPSKFYIKRVIGLPGEQVEVRGSQVRISNSEGSVDFVLDEPYVSPQNIRQDFVFLTLKDDEYFVLGDNRKVSSDSRVWGAVTRDHIIGKALIRLLPVGQATLHPGSVPLKE